MQKFSEAAGNLYAVMNWTARHKEDDAALLKILTSEEVHAYQRYKEEGLSDTAIFQRMFPSPPPEQAAIPRIIEIDIRRISKRQLVRLIEAELDVAVTSLERCSREDLERLLMRLHHRG